MSSSQVGKTLIFKAVIGFHIDVDPAPMLVVQPTVEMAETFSKDRLAPMIRDTPVLRGKVNDAKSRDSGNTIQKKNFPGGHITMIGANAPAALASRPIRIVLCDEVDRYPASAGTEQADNHIPLAQACRVVFDADDQGQKPDRAGVEAKRPTALLRAVPALRRCACSALGKYLDHRR